MSVYKVEGRHVKAGITSGIIAGAVFGAMMGMMGMLPMVAKLGGGESPVFGFLIHLIFSAIIGALFAVFLGHAIDSRKSGLTWGLVYGAIWWVLGPLIIMPTWLGMGLMLSAEGMTKALPSLWGHLVFGFLLGLVYPLIVNGKTVR